MKITLQFVLAILFAAAAAGLNWFYLSLQTTPRIDAFVMVGAEIKRGERIDADKLIKFEVARIKGDQTDLSASSLIPFSRREVLYNLESPRTYRKGDFILLQDITETRTAEYDSLGPFRLLSVGDQLTNQIGADRGSGQVLTLAVDKQYDEKTKRLIQILQRQKESGMDQDPLRIIGIEILQRTTDPVEPGPVRKLDLRENEVAIFVDISDLDSVPSILSAGDQIRFTIPRIPLLASE